MNLLKTFSIIFNTLLFLVSSPCSLLVAKDYPFKQVMPRSQWMDYRPDEPHRAVILDGEGGAIVASVALGPIWLLAQKIDRYGNVLWAEPGQARKVALDTPIDDENYAPIMVSDGSGGVFIAYAYCDVTYDTLIHLQYDVYVQHIARDFERLWGDRGVAVSAIDSIIGEYPHGLITDDNGGIIVLYQGPTESYYPTMYLQKISSNGTILWPDLGKKVIEDDTLGVIHIVADDEGGALVFGNEKYAQRINNSGQFLWQLPYVSTGLPHLPWLWFFRNKEVNNTITIVGYNRAQKILEEKGSILWGDTGVVWDHPSITHYNPIITCNGNGGAFLFFSHFIQELDRDGNYVYDSPITALDTTLFKNEPIPVSGEYAEGHGAFVLYVNSVNWDSAQVVLQKITPDGDLPWGTTGITICDTAAFLLAFSSLIRIDTEFNEAFIFVVFHSGIFVTKVDLNTGSPVTNVKPRYKQIPTEFQLTTYPNPFSYSTFINITGLKPDHSKLIIKIYDILGREVIDLSCQLKNSFKKQITWRGVNFRNQQVAPGIYFVKVNGANQMQVQKIVKIN